jgi:hypothetical protein
LAAPSTHPEDRRSKIVTATQAESQATELAERTLREQPTPLLQTRSALNIPTLSLERVRAALCRGGEVFNL